MAADQPPDPGAAPRPDTALHRAIAVGTASGTAAGTAVGAAVEHAAGGLRGWPAQIANMSAIAVIMLVFWVNNNRQFDTAREDRRMYQIETQYMRESTNAQTERTMTKLDLVASRMDALSAIMQAAAAEMRASRVSVQAAEKAISAKSGPDQ